MKKKIIVALVLLLLFLAAQPSGSPLNPYWRTVKYYSYTLYHMIRYGRKKLPPAKGSQKRDKHPKTVRTLKIMEEMGEENVPETTDDRMAKTFENWKEEE